MKISTITFVCTSLALIVSQAHANKLPRRIRRALEEKQLFRDDSGADDVSGEDDSEYYLVMSVSPVPPTGSPTLAPTESCPNREINLKQILFDISGSLIDDPNTAQGQAYEWMLNEDPLELCPSLDCKFVQRYALAVFYYAAGGDGWSNCSRFPTDSNCTADLNQENWSCNPSRWLSADDECDWCGNECFDDTQCMRGINIEFNGQEGFLPDEISELTKLQYFILEQGKIGGEIPSIWGEKMPDMRTLDLDFEELTGSIPETIYTGMTRLLTLDLNDNDLTGGLSTNIGLLKELQFFQLHSNVQVTGPIPDELTGLIDLRRLELHETSLTGDVPDGMCDGPNKLLPNLTDFSTTCDNNCTCCNYCRDP